MPKKTRKGGGGKGGGRMERLEFLQQRAQAEEEMAKKREETLALFLKDKLEKEEKNTAENLRKLNEGWRAILRQTRDPELRQEISTSGQTFERQLENLDSTIKDLLRNLQEKERQSACERRVHLQHLERLWALHESHMTFVQQHWEQGMQQLSSRFSSEEKKMLARSQQRQTDLEDAAFTLEQQHKDVMTEIHHLYSASIAAHKGALEDRDGNEMLKEKEEETLQMQKCLWLCPKKQEEVESLVAEEQLYFQITTGKMREVKELQDSVIQMREKLNSSQTDHEAEERHLTATSDQVNKKTDQLRQRLSEGRATARKQLTQLTVQSSDAARKLQAVIAKGERTLRAAEMCQKLERKHEKLLISSSLSSSQIHAPVTEKEEPAKDLSGFPELQQLMRRMNTAELLRDALKRQRRDLSRQNQQLRLQLRQQVDHMSVTDHAADAHHALLTISRAPSTTAPPDSHRRHDVIRVVQSVQHTVSQKKP